MLPRVKTDFRTVGYWDSFFKKLKNQKKSFEWYLNWHEILPYWSQICPNKLSEILVIGCGNSDLSAELYDFGYKKLTNVDFSEPVIKEMKTKNQTRPEMKWLVMDVMNMNFENENFEVVLDKGALDAIFTDDSPAVSADIDRLFQQLKRVLKPRGVYICITLAQEHILHKLLNSFREGFNLRFYASITGSVSHIPFIVVIEKLSNSSQKRVLSSIFDGGSRLYSSATKSTQEEEDSLKEHIREVQWYIHCKENLLTIADDRILSLDLWSDEGQQPTGPIESDHHNTPRYSLSIIDKKVAGKLEDQRCGVFIVPQGKEHSWLFDSDEGKQELRSSCQMNRLILVKMNRFHTFQNLQSVKDELSPKVLQLIPVVCRQQQIPFLTIGEGIGQRTVIETFKSSFSGDITVEEVFENELKVRRIVFSDNPHLIQSEVRLKPAETKPAKLSKAQRKKLAAKQNAQPTPPNNAQNDESSALTGQQKQNPTPPQAKQQSQHEEEDSSKIENWEVDTSYLVGGYYQGMIAGLSLTSHLLKKCLNFKPQKTQSQISTPSSSTQQTTPNSTNSPTLENENTSTTSLPPTEGVQKPVQENALGKNENGSEYVQVLVVGLGGGSLCSFLYEYFNGFSIEALEIDPTVVEIAQKYFALPQQNNRFQVRVIDALQFIEQSSQKKDIIVIDVDNKDSTTGITAPPSDFLTKPFLKKLKELVSSDPTRNSSGVVIFNVATRSRSLYQQIFDSLSAVFPRIYQLTFDEYTNSVLFCFPTTSVSQSPDETGEPHKAFKFGKGFGKQWHADLGFDKIKTEIVQVTGEVDQPQTTESAGPNKTLNNNNSIPKSAPKNTAKTQPKQPSQPEAQPKNQNQTSNHKKNKNKKKK